MIKIRLGIKVSEVRRRYKQETKYGKGREGRMKEMSSTERKHKHKQMPVKEQDRVRVVAFVGHRRPLVSRSLFLICTPHALAS